MLHGALMAVGLMPSIFLQVILETLILLNDLCHSQGYTTNALEACSKQRAREKNGSQNSTKALEFITFQVQGGCQICCKKYYNGDIYIGLFNKGSLLSTVGQAQGLILFS